MATHEDLARRTKRDADRWIAAGFGSLTLALGALRAGDTALWIDEAFSAQFVDRPFAEMVSALGSEAGMGPYYLALWAWNQVGSSEWWLRMLSVAGGAFAVAALYLLARRLINRAVGCLAALGLICNPFFLRNLTELRAYSWTMFLGVVCTSTFVSLRTDRRRRTAVAYGVSVGMLLSVMSFSIGIIVAHGLFSVPLLRCRAGRRGLAIAAIVAAVLFSPFVAALATSDQLNWIAAPTPTGVIRAIGTLFGGYVIGTVVVLGNLCLVAALVISRRGDDHWQLRLIIAAQVASPTVLLAVSAFTPVFLSRYMSAALPLALLAAAAGFVLLAQQLTMPNWMRHVAVGSITVAFLAGFPGSPWRGQDRAEVLERTAKYLDANVLATDAIVYDPAVLDSGLDYYRNERTGITLSTSTAVGDTRVDRFCRIWQVSAITEGFPIDLLEALQRAGGRTTIEHFDGFTVIVTDACSS